VSDSHPVGIKSLDHVGLYVSDLEVTRHFYCDLLDMVELERPESFDFPGFWFKAGEAQVHVFLERAPGRVAETIGDAAIGEERERGFWNHMAIEVEDVETARAALEALEIPLIGGPHTRSDGVRQIYLLDPDGYMIEFYSGGYEYRPGQN
jgi:catechol 2,3-dioxygenase-like lactoylglutathione lyase family enzyme